MSTRRAAFFDHTPDTPVKVKGIILVLLLCVYTACVVLYISASNTAMRVTKQSRNLLLRIEQMKATEEATLEYMGRLAKQQERRIVRQNALMQNLMSQSEVLFDDLEIISQMQERKRVKSGLRDNSTASGRLGMAAELSYSLEYARRRTENIVRELWFFVHDQLKDLNKEIAAEKEMDNKTAQLSLTTTPQDSQEILNESWIPNSSLSHPSKIYTGEQDSNITSEKASEPTLGILITSETVEENVSSSLRFSNLEDIQIPLTNNPHRFVSVINHKLRMISHELTGYRRALTDAFTVLREADHSEKVRQHMSMELGCLVQRRLDLIQNPKDCRKAQRAACFPKPCGFGCNFHHYVYCLITAYATNRTLLIQTPPSWAPLLDPASSKCSLTDPKLPAGSEETAEGDFNPVQNASSQSNRSDHEEMPPQVEMLPVIDDLEEEKRQHVPLSVPRDLAVKLATFHGNPAAWWVGQVASYLFRPTSLLMGHIKQLQRTLGFKKPIVGVHVRRTDKLLAEASYHSLEEYMLHVEDYYDQLERSQQVATRRVFLATDDPTLLPEAQAKYPNYTFSSDANASKVLVEERDLDNSVRGIATDIFFLSRTDFLVCTFSSQVCRLAYELMQAQHGDASGKFRSLDDIYYFGGQVNHKMVAVESYKASWEDTISLEKGDKILVAGNHWNGFSRGLNERTSQEGLYPSYAVEDTVVSYPMPEYFNVH